ncbi:MAG: YqeG family HAD IIIA-type phosphatase, partial [Acutalibacteraceae bacterium]
VFTDIFGANRSGIPSILVQFIQHDGKIDFGIRRKLEKKVLDRYLKESYYQHRLGSIEIEK